MHSPRDFEDRGAVMTPDLNRFLDVIRDRRRMLGKKPGQQITLDLDMCEAAMKVVMRMMGDRAAISQAVASAPDMKEA